MIIKFPLVALFAGVLFASGATAGASAGFDTARPELRAEDAASFCSNSIPVNDEPVNAVTALPSRAGRSPNRRSELPRSAQRPEAFWWSSPEVIFASLYGACGPRDCCKFCVKGKACGNTCIARTKTCRVGCGCACQKPVFFASE